MKRCKGILVVAGYFMCVFSHAQSKGLSGTDTTYVNTLLDQSKEYFGKDPAKAITLAVQAKELAEKIGFIKGKALALKNAGIGYYYQGKYLETLDYWNQSLDLFKEMNDDVGVANLLNNKAAIYYDQGDDAKALEYALESLRLSETSNDKLRILSALNTVGSIYFNKEATWNKALDYLLRALPLCEELGDKDAYGTLSGNIGEIYFQNKNDAKALDYFNKSIKALGSNSAKTSFAYNGIGKIYLRKGNFEEALSYHYKALNIAERLDDKLNKVRSLQGIANVYIHQKDYTSALSFYEEATTIAEEMKATLELKDLYGELAKTYNAKANFSQAYKYLLLQSGVKDTLYNVATNKKLANLQFEFDLQKKQGEINLLTKDKALTDLQLKRQKLAKWTLLGGLGFVLLIALLVFRNYRVKARTNRILDKQKVEIENLLLNILPSEVAQELQTKGEATPRSYDMVSVLFTDFKGFTAIADKMSPEELVQELNTCFIAFDEIIEKYKLEKIKTIGDAYMCAGGIPTPDPQHIYNIIQAAIEIKEYVAANNRRRAESGHLPWYLRIGIHAGPLVAGVVGKKKYAYDIWGATVNIASRMESNGEPGKVNISSTVYEMVKDKYDCIYRGKIHAKNIGEIDMYFIEKEKEESVTPKAIPAKALKAD